MFLVLTLSLAQGTFRDKFSIIIPSRPELVSGLLDVTCCSLSQTSIPGLLLPPALPVPIALINNSAATRQPSLHQRGAHCHLITDLRVSMTEPVPGWVWLKVSWHMPRFYQLFQLEPTAWRHSAAKQSFLQPETLNAISAGVSLSLRRGVHRSQKETWWSISFAMEIASTCDIWGGWIPHELIFRTRAAEQPDNSFISIRVGEEPRPLSVLTEVKDGKHNRNLKSFTVHVCMWSRVHLYVQ